MNKYNKKYTDFANAQLMMHHFCNSYLWLGGNSVYKLENVERSIKNIRKDFDQCKGWLSRDMRRFLSREMKTIEKEYQKIVENNSEMNKIARKHLFHHHSHFNLKSKTNTTIVFINSPADATFTYKNNENVLHYHFAKWGDSEVFGTLDIDEEIKDRIKFFKTFFS